MNDIINSDIFKFLIEHGYLIMFWFAILEGPIIGFFWAVWAILGFFDIRIVFIISLMWDLIWDSIYYLIWRFWSKIRKEKMWKNKWFLHKIWKLINNHPIKSLILVKFTPYMQPPGLIFLGYKKMNFKKFIIWSFILSLPNSVIFVLWWYFFTNKTIKLLELIDIYWLPYLIIPIILIILILVYKKFLEKISDC